MKKFTFKISEKTTYWQSGTVSVEEESLAKAKKLVLGGEYEHHGDNEIDLNTEGECIEREIDHQIKD